jgi:hypothetical protein
LIERFTGLKIMADEKIKCTLCQKDFPAEQIIKSLLMPEEYPYLCSDCHLIVCSWSMDEDEDNEIFAYQCLGCGLSFDKENIFVPDCPICGCPLEEMSF